MKQLLLVVCVAWASLLFAEKEVVKLASTPALSPDGATLVFEYRGDLWAVSSEGGQAHPLTTHPAEDMRPVFSPDGKQLAFASKRSGTWQIFVMSAKGGTPKQLTFHTEGAFPLGWFPDGTAVLSVSSRARFGYMQSRLFRVSVTEKKAPEMLFDASAQEASLSPDGKKVLFTVNKMHLYRRGYKGSAAAQLWLRNLNGGEEETRIFPDQTGIRTPMWKPDGLGFYFLRQTTDCFNLWSYDFKSKQQKPLTFFTDGSIILPTLSKDGNVIVFRQLFDFYSIRPNDPKSLKKVEIWVESDDSQSKVLRRYYNKVWNNDVAGSVDSTEDGKQICFTAGGDLWVMDTILREPKLVCGETQTHESEAVFSKNQNKIYFLRDDGLGVNIWTAQRKDTSLAWWENDAFVLTPLTSDQKTRFNLQLSPDGKRISVVESGFHLRTFKLDGSDARTVFSAPFPIYYDWAPDGNWLTVAAKDSWGNSDVWIVNEAGKRKPYNVSRHPNWDYNPRWSPDGRKIAFIGKRYDNSENIYFVYLRQKDENQTALQRKKEKAAKAMKKSGKKNEKKKSEEKATQVQIDFDGLFERVHRLQKGGSPANLFWSYDSKALAFEGVVKGESAGRTKLSFRAEVQQSL